MEKLAKAILARAIWIAVALVLFLAWVSNAEAHDIYTGWRNKTGLRCCGGEDCAVYPAEKVFAMHGGYRLANGAFIANNEVLESPDGFYHVCIWKNEMVVRCFAAPNAG